MAIRARFIMDLLTLKELSCVSVHFSVIQN